LAHALGFTRGKTPAPSCLCELFSRLDPVAFEAALKWAGLRQGFYAVQVRIETTGRLDYINDTRAEVVSSGKPSQDVKVPVIRVKK
jgi:hypothetical protein